MSGSGGPVFRCGVDPGSGRGNAVCAGICVGALFYERIRDLPNVTLYGDPEMAPRAPIVALNIGSEDSARIADILWETTASAYVLVRIVRR